MGSLVWTAIIYACTILIVLVVFRCFKDDQKEANKVVLSGRFRQAEGPVAGERQTASVVAVRDRTGISPNIRRGV